MWSPSSAAVGLSRFSSRYMKQASCVYYTLQGLRMVCRILWFSSETPSNMSILQSLVTLAHCTDLGSIHNPKKHGAMEYVSRNSMRAWWMFGLSSPSYIISIQPQAKSWRWKIFFNAYFKELFDNSIWYQNHYSIYQSQRTKWPPVLFHQPTMPKSNMTTIHQRPYGVSMEHYLPKTTIVFIPSSHIKPTTTQGDLQYMHGTEIWLIRNLMSYPLHWHSDFSLLEYGLRLLSHYAWRSRSGLQ